jgi:hypothetical protein
MIMFFLIFFVMIAIFEVFGATVDYDPNLHP